VPGRSAVTADDPAAAPPSSGCRGAAPSQIHYAAAKAGVIAFTRCCAEAFAPHNVRINCVAPGLIDTEMARVLPPAARQAVVEQTPLGRLGTAKEVAAVIRFLLSEESSFMTGQTVAASGGRVMLP
jgi:3-oxoacyl-[acyl-carrier protein] reductase